MIDSKIANRRLKIIIEIWAELRIDDLSFVIDNDGSSMLCVEVDEVVTAYALELFIDSFFDGLLGKASQGIVCNGKMWITVDWTFDNDVLREAFKKLS